MKKEFYAIYDNESGTWLSDYDPSKKDSSSWGGFYIEYDSNEMIGEIAKGAQFDALDEAKKVAESIVQDMLLWKDDFTKDFLFVDKECISLEIAKISTETVTIIRKEADVNWLDKVEHTVEGRQTRDKVLDAIKDALTSSFDEPVLDRSGDANLMSEAIYETLKERGILKQE